FQVRLPSVDGGAQGEKGGFHLLDELCVPGAEGGFMRLEMIEVGGDQRPSRASAIAFASERDGVAHRRASLREAVRRTLDVLGEWTGAHRRERLFPFAR